MAAYHIRDRPPHGLLHMSPVNELPTKNGSQFFSRGPSALNRRQALSLLASGIATSLAACSKPVRADHSLCQNARAGGPGRQAEIRDHAAAFRVRTGCHRDVDRWAPDQGRRQSATSGKPWMQPTCLPKRRCCRSMTRTVRARSYNNGAIASPESFRLALQSQLQKMRTSGGRRFPASDRARDVAHAVAADRQSAPIVSESGSWHAYEPVDDDSDRAGAALAYRHGR